MVMLLFLFSVPVTASSQEMQPPPSPPGAGQNQNAPAYTQQQLDQMVAPIALYPDPLVAQILMAATYPLEVVQADRWAKDPQNAALKGDQLAAVLQQQPWDPSVKSLVPFPQVLQTMDKNLQWTEQLGDAFLAQQPAVMNSVQQLRQQAQAAGTLQSTPQQTVSQQGPAIVIEPASPQTVYVPYYNPAVVYGTWPYPGYPPYYFPSPFGYAYDDGLFDFGLGFAVIGSFWGWEAWDWHNHRININNDRFRGINNGRPGNASGVWQHNPEHRGGVPYNSAATRAQYQRGSEQARNSYRGYSAENASQAGRNSSGARFAAREMSNRAAASGVQVYRPTRAQSPAAESFARPAAQTGMEERPSAPVFESFSNGAQARAQAGTRCLQSFSRHVGQKRWRGACVVEAAVAMAVAAVDTDEY